LPLAQKTKKKAAYLSASIPIILIHNPLDELCRHGLFGFRRIPSDRSIVKQWKPNFEKTYKNEKLRVTAMF